MGGKTSTSTQSVSIPPEVLARYNAVNARAEDVAQRPFQTYGTDASAFVAPLSQTQQAGIAGTNAASGMAQPYYQSATNALYRGQAQAEPYFEAATRSLQGGQGVANTLQQQAIDTTSRAEQSGLPFLATATGMALQGAGPTNVGRLSRSDIQEYMNPFVESVVDPTSRLLRQQQEQQMSGQTANAIRSGAFGGDRAGVAAANLAGQQSLAYANAINPLYSQAYQQGLGTAQQQQGLDLQQRQANLSRLSQGAQLQAALGQQGYQQGMGAAQQRAALAGQIFGQGATAAQQQAALGQGLYGMGQGVSQAAAGLGAGAQTAALQGAAAQLQAGQQQQQTEQAGKQALYNQFLQQQGYPFQVAQFLANIAMGTGALSGSTTTTTQPAPFFSDRRLKHDIHRIGETDDGMPIYKFKYKGDPREQTHIGLMAQDVEKTRPEAVGVAGGYKTVDYDRATRASGGLVPSSEGGGVWPEMAGEGYADGGMPQLDIFGGGPSRIPASVLAQMQNLPRRQLMTPSMGLKPQSTGFADAMAEAQKALGAGETLKKLYEGGTKVSDWLQGKAGGGSVDPYDPDEKRPDFMTSVLREGKIDTQSLPKPGQLPSQKSGMSDLASGVGALKTLYDVGSTAMEFLPMLFLKDGGRVGYADGGPTDEDIDAFFERMIQKESRGRQFGPNGEPLRSPKGATGIAQVMPKTAPEAARMAGLDFDEERYQRDPEYNRALGRAYFGQQVKDFGSLPLAAAAYNAGPGRLRDAIQKANASGGDVIGLLPAETRNYVASLKGQPDTVPANLITESAGVMPPARRVTPIEEGATRSPSRAGLSPRPGALSETPENAPFRTLFGGALEGQGLKPATKAALTSENFWLPLISGVGSMLGSPSITLGGAIGHGLMGGAKTYADLQKQQADIEERKAGIEESGARTVATEMQTLQRSLQTLQNGLNIVWLANGKPMLLSDYEEMRKAGRQPPLLGARPRNADQIVEEFLGGKSPVPTVKAPPAPEAPKPTEASSPKKTEDPFEPPPQEKPEPLPGVGFDDKSEKAAALERQKFLGGGPESEEARDNSKKYASMVKDVANSARDSSRFITELAENLSNAVQGRGIDAPGAGYDARAQIVNVANTIARAFGLPDTIGSSDTIKQINEKISAMQAAAQTKGVGQESYAALSLIKNAIANPKMSPRAFSKLSADLMAQNQRAIDRHNHYELYSRASGATATGASSDFERLNSAGKYNNEATALAELIMKDPKLIKDMREGKYTPADIDKAFKQRYGIDGMSRYFIGGR